MKIPKSSTVNGMLGRRVLLKSVNEIGIRIDMPTAIIMKPSLIFIAKRL